MKKLVLTIVVLAVIAAGTWHLMQTEQEGDVTNEVREQAGGNELTAEDMQADPVRMREPETSMPEEPGQNGVEAADSDPVDTSLPEGPIHVGGAVNAPVKVSGSQPQYTDIAKKARIQGLVIVQSIIDKTGNVTETKVLKGLPMGLDHQAIEAIKTWTFEPATLNGEPVSVYYNLTVNFQLQ